MTNYIQDLIQNMIKTLLIAFVFFTTNKAVALTSKISEANTSDTTVIINFNWELENKIRQNDKLTLVSARICSRWIDFSEQEFSKLKAFDGKNVKIRIRHSVIEGLHSKKNRGVDITLMQGTEDDINCDRILSIKLNE